MDAADSVSMEDGELIRAEIAQRERDGASSSVDSVVKGPGSVALEALHLFANRM